MNYKISNFVYICSLNTNSLMEVPKQFAKKSFLWLTVLFEAVVSIVFLILYSPFNGEFWFGFNGPKDGFYTVLFFVLAYGLLFLSRTGFYVAQKKYRMPLTMVTLCIWFLVDILFVALIYMALTDFMGMRPTYMSQSQQLIRTYGLVGLVRFIPFLLSFERGVALDYREEAHAMKVDHLGSESMVLGANLINLYDHSGALKITAAQNDIYYLESQDNYVSLHYMVDGKMTEYLLRCSTVEVEESVKNTSIVRCHRSYLVNLNHIKMLKHEKGRASIVLSDFSDMEIPVSKSYYNDLVELVLPDKVVGK